MPITDRSTHFAMAFFICILLLGAHFGCGRSSTDTIPAPTTSAGTTGQAATESARVPVPSNAIELVFPYGSEKEKWLEAVTAEFNQAENKTESGQPIYVKAIPMGSGELTTEILEGRLEAHLASPASAVFIELGNAQSQAKAGRPLVGDTQDLVLSPVVIAMWQPMAEALGWGEKPIGWADILQLADDPQGWEKYGYPQWGQFKFGHTHPLYSNSGIISLFAEVYAGAGKVNGLSLGDLEKPEVVDFLRDIEQSVVHYGSSTGFFGRKMFAGGPEYLSAAVLYENMVIESYDSDHSLPFPVVAVYPKEGTFWSDHPVGIVDRPHVTEKHREAAEKYIDFLTAPEQQRRAMEFGFRPADVTIPLGAPVDTDHGVDPNQPQTTLEVPSAQVMNAILDLWKANKKHANVVLVLDTSGSMKGDKMSNAKLGAEQLVTMMGGEDMLALLPFNDKVKFAQTGLKIGDSRDVANRTINSYFANGGTALYDAITAAHKRLADQPTTDRISAIVVLSDGADRNSKTRLTELLEKIKADYETRSSIRIFTIGYGDEANEQVLEQIAEVTGAKYYHGSTDNIREVFKDISTFF